MMTLLPPGAGAPLLPPLVPDLLLEHPASPDTTVATAAMPTTIPRFANGLPMPFAEETRTKTALPRPICVDRTLRPAAG